MTDTEYSLRSATSADAAKVTALVMASHGHYPEQIGMVPRPMTDHQVQVTTNVEARGAENYRAIVGMIVLAIGDDELRIDNVAVDPSYRGEGLGKALLKFVEAEARRAGFDSI